MGNDLLNETGFSASGVATMKRKLFKELKIKWNELGPLKLEDIIANATTEPFNYEIKTFEKSDANENITGQKSENGKIHGVGKVIDKVNIVIYEG